jgi:putative transposase
MNGPHPWRVRIGQAEERPMDQQSVRKTFKYQLQPTAEQEGTLGCILRRCRDLYTAGLEERREAGRMRRVNITMAGPSAHLPASKPERPEDQDSHSQVLPDVLARLDRACQAFLRRGEPGETPGSPRFKSRRRDDSFTYKQFGTGATRDNGLLVLCKIGRIAVRWRRPLEGAPQTGTIRREADGWDVTVCWADGPLKPLPLTGQETGIDLGLESVATVAQGSQIANPRLFHVAERTLKRAQRRVSRRVKDSKRRRTAVTVLAKAHARVRRARADFPHQTALARVRQDDTIAHDDWQPANLLKTHQLAKSISAAGGSGVLPILSFTAGEAGQTVVAGPAAFTSPACSGGGVLGPKGLSVRGQACPEGGTSLHRDHHAALNRLASGTEPRGAGQAPQARTPPVGAYGA